MATTVKNMGERYKAINLSKITNDKIKKDLAEIAENTENFTDVEIMEIELKSFQIIESIIEKNFPEALGGKVETSKKPAAKPATKKQPKKVVDKPAAKKEPKKPAYKPAKAPKQVSQAELSDQEKFFEDCKNAIRDLNSQKKMAKLSEYKADKIAKLKEKPNVSTKELTEKIAQVEAMTYKDAFTPKKSIASVMTEKVFDIFEMTAKATVNIAASNDDLKGSDKSYVFQKRMKPIVAFFVETVLPKSHTFVSGAKANSYIEDFEKKASRLIEEYAGRLDKKFVKKEETVTA